MWYPIEDHTDEESRREAGRERALCQVSISLPCGGAGFPHVSKIVYLLQETYAQILSLASPIRFLARFAFRLFCKRDAAM